MIRINLLPRTKRASRARGGGNAQAWYALYAAVIGVYLVGLGIVYVVVSSELDGVQASNSSLEDQIRQAQTLTARLAEVEAQIDQSQRLEALVNELNTGRTGPTRMLLEVSRLLSDGQGPSIDPQRLEELRRVNPHAGYNRNWDVRRLWLNSFEEEAGDCVIRGIGKTNEDIAEFLQRLTLSDLFDEVMLTRTEAVSDDETRMDFIGFELQCRVTY
jgi:type IV pilus assembly protein PilN